MELQFYHSYSLRISAIKPCQTYCHRIRMPFKHSCLDPDLLFKCSQNWPSTGLYNHRRTCIKDLTKQHYRRNIIWACSRIGAAGSDSMMNNVLNFKDACWRFLRPHTIRGTILGSVSLVARALIENSDLIKWSLVLKALSGLFALICGNGYIVGINQIYDIEIDNFDRLRVLELLTLVGIFFGLYTSPRVNKPYLPMAAGDLSVRSAWLLVIFFAIAGLLVVGLNFGLFITSLYSLGLLLGTIYSVPPFRLRRFPVVAFLIIATVRGFLLNFGVYHATRAALGLTFVWSSPVAFITTFVTIFALVIAITKDLPDVEGDRKFKISTLATNLGVRNISFLGTGLLLVNYIGAVFMATYMPQAFRSRIMITAHTILAACLIFQIIIDGSLKNVHHVPSRSKLINDFAGNLSGNPYKASLAWVLERAKYTKEAISEFYRFIWYLFYAEYIIFPFI